MDVLREAVSALAATAHQVGIAGEINTPYRVEGSAGVSLIELPLLVELPPLSRIAPLSRNYMEYTDENVAS